MITMLKKAATANKRSLIASVDKHNRLFDACTLQERFIPYLCTDGIAVQSRIM